MYVILSGSIINTFLLENDYQHQLQFKVYSGNSSFARKTLESYYYIAIFYRFPMGKTEKTNSIVAFM